MFIITKFILALDAYFATQYWKMFIVSKYIFMTVIILQENPPEKSNYILYE